MLSQFYLHFSVWKFSSALKVYWYVLAKNDQFQRNTNIYKPVRTQTNTWCSLSREHFKQALLKTNNQNFYKHLIQPREI